MTAQVVVITGASSGIGAATARTFLDAGARVFNLDLAPAGGAPGEWLACDVTDHDQVDARLAEIVRLTGRVDVAIANAGISIRRPFLEMQRADIDKVFAVNVHGVINLWQAAGRRMFDAGSGVLLATASTNATAGYPWYADYNASKAAVLALCRSVALELAPVVRTACVSPGYVMTPMQRSEYSDEMLAEVNATVPSGRHAEPAEIAAAFQFLASPQAAFITGQQLVVDGGELAGGTASRYRTWGAEL